MDEVLARAVAATIAAATGRAAEVRAARPVGGGCIHEARLIELADGRRWFVKASREAPADLFPAEAAGLRALAAVGELRVPSEATAGESEAAEWRYLVMEAIDTGAPGAGFHRELGRRLARLHRRGRGERYGFAGDNYLGATPQPNPWSDDWCDFWRRHRLGHQLALARQNGVADRELDRLGDRLADRLDEWLAEPAEPPALVHGDLWSGNYLADAAGEPVLVDPAAYYGRREAELGMTRLFGGFPDDFYRAYEDEWPLAPGSEERLAIYELYHLLNHLNLFGRGYRAGCVARLRRLVG